MTDGPLYLSEIFITLGKGKKHCSFADRVIKRACVCVSVPLLIRQGIFHWILMPFLSSDVVVFFKSTHLGK